MVSRNWSPQSGHSRSVGSPRARSTNRLGLLLPESIEIEQMCLHCSRLPIDSGPIWKLEIIAAIVLRRGMREARGDLPQLRSDKKMARAALKFAFLVSIACVAGCGRSLYRTSEIQPGEADYPVANRKPQHVLEFRTQVPPGLIVHFAANYRVSASAGGTFASGTSCQRERGMSGSAAFTLSVPIKFANIGKDLVGQVPIDGFEPGRCDWTFTDISYEVETSEVEAQPLAYYYGRQGEPSDRKVDIWCTRKEKFEGQSVFCAGLHFLNLKFPQLVPKSALTTEAQAGQANDDPVNLGLASESLTVQFHDFDAMFSTESLPKPVER